MEWLHPSLVKLEHIMTSMGWIVSQDVSCVPRGTPVLKRGLLNMTIIRKSLTYVRRGMLVLKGWMYSSPVGLAITRTALCRALVNCVQWANSVWKAPIMEGTIVKQALFASWVQTPLLILCVQQATTARKTLWSIVLFRSWKSLNSLVWWRKSD